MPKSEFPKPILKLYKSVVANFYSIEHLKFVEVLLSKPYRIFTEHAIIENLKIDLKSMRVVGNHLKSEKIVKSAVKTYPSPTNPEIQYRTTVYWLDIPGLINMVRYKIDQIQSVFQKSEQNTIGKALFTCTFCQKSFTDLQISDIFDPFTNRFKCTFCERELEECDQKTGNNDNSNLTSLLNNQLEPIFSLLKTIEKLDVSETILRVGLKKFENTHSQEMNSNEIALATRNSTVDNEHLINLDKNDDKASEITMDISMNVQNNSEEMKAVPEWLKDTYADKSDKTNSKNASENLVDKKKKAVEVEELLLAETGAGIREENVREGAEKQIRNNSNDKTFENGSEVPKIKIGDEFYPIDEIPEHLMTEMDDDTQQRYLDLCDAFY